MNPLIDKFDITPFSKIKNEDFIPGFKHAITLAKEEINTIVENSDVPTFKNTIEALDYSGEQLDRVSSVFFNLNLSGCFLNSEIMKAY